LSPPALFAAPPGDDVRSPQTYVGYARSENVASPIMDPIQAPTAPARFASLGCISSPAKGIDHRRDL
jgi:hypothetical protein